MTFKDSVLKELSINPNIDYDEASLRIEGLKEKTFNNVRTGFWKINGNKPNILPEPIQKNNILPGVDFPGQERLENTSKPIERLSSDNLEKRLINALNQQPNNANLLGKAIDFFIKVKDKASEMEEEIDIKELLKSGIVKNFEPNTVNKDIRDDKKDYFKD